VAKRNSVAVGGASGCGVRKEKEGVVRHWGCGSLFRVTKASGRFLSGFSLCRGLRETLYVEVCVEIGVGGRRLCELGQQRKGACWMEWPCFLF
jgi:hypothetical protein